MIRKLAAAVMLGIFGAAASSSMADTYVAATLTGVSPALSTATLNGSGDYYAGLLNWNVAATTNSAVFAVGSDFNTYCVDISHDIGIGGTYQYDLTTLSHAAALSGTYNYGTGTVSMVEAIDTLYSEFYGGSTTASGPYSADQEAAAFQGAVWTILFTPPNTVGLGNTGATTLENSELTALDHQLATAGGLDAYNVMALVADPGGPLTDYTVQGQDQALVVMPGFGSSPVPLPSTSMGGCVLLGLFGLGAISKRRLSLAR